MTDYPSLITFNNVRVFAVDTDQPADAIYKNLFWETFPVPDILYNIYTPPIVSTIQSGKYQGVTIK